MPLDIKAEKISRILQSGRLEKKILNVTMKCVMY